MWGVGYQFAADTSRIALLGVAGIGAALAPGYRVGDSPAAATEVVSLSAGAALALSSLGFVVTHHLGQQRLFVYLWVAALARGLLRHRRRTTRLSVYVPVSEG